MRKQPLSEKELARMVSRERVHILYKQAPASVCLELIVAAFIALTTYKQLPEGMALTWWAVMSIIVMIDFSGYFAYRYAVAKGRSLRPVYRLFLLSVAVLSTCWGIAVVYLLNHLDLMYQAYLVGIIMAIAGMTLAELSIRALPFGLFLCGILLPSCVWLMMQGSELQLYCGVLLLVYGVALFFGGLKLSENLSGALRLKFENEELANSLKNSNTKLQTLNQELTQLSSTDSLTKVANRRYFEERLDKEWRRLVREEGELAIIMIDVDFFKLYNDALGHQAGDTCLFKVASSVKDSLRRPADMVARYGGEEFIVLLPNTSKEGAVRVAEVMRENILQMEVPHPGSTVNKYVTASFGIGHCTPSEGVTRRQLIAKADEALYASKDHGRNQVTFKSL